MFLYSTNLVFLLEQYDFRLAFCTLRCREQIKAGMFAVPVHILTIGCVLQKGYKGRGGGAESHKRLWGKINRVACGDRITLLLFCARRCVAAQAGSQQQFTCTTFGFTSARTPSASYLHFFVRWFAVGYTMQVMVFYVRRVGVRLVGQIEDFSPSSDALLLDLHICLRATVFAVDAGNVVEYAHGW